MNPSLELAEISSSSQCACIFNSMATSYSASFSFQSLCVLCCVTGLWLSGSIWGCGNETREGARWQSVGSLGLERDGQDKQATGGLKNEWINIQTKVNSAGESNPVSVASEVWTHEFSFKSLKELLCIWFLSSLALGRCGWGQSHSSSSSAGTVRFSLAWLSVRFLLKNQ